MTCERYWREGIEMVDGDKLDPHIETCEDCRREHRAREQMIHAIRLIGADVAGNPNWKARVWQEVDRGQAKPKRGLWFFASAFVSTVALLLIWLIPLRTSVPPVASLAERVEVIRGSEPTRSVPLDSSTAGLGDHLHIRINSGEETRIYHGQRLVVRCAAGQTGKGCLSDGRGVIADVYLITPGRYLVMMLQLGTADGIPEPTGTLEGDQRAIEGVDAKNQSIELTIE